MRGWRDATVILQQVAMPRGTPHTQSLRDAPAPRECLRLLIEEAVVTNRAFIQAVPSARSALLDLLHWVLLLFTQPLLQVSSSETSSLLYPDLAQPLPTALC